MFSVSGGSKKGGNDKTDWHTKKWGERERRENNCRGTRKSRNIISLNQKAHSLVVFLGLLRGGSLAEGLGDLNRGSFHRLGVASHLCHFGLDRGRGHRRGLPRDVAAGHGLRVRYNFDLGVDVEQTANRRVLQE